MMNKNDEAGIEIIKTENLYTFENIKKLTLLVKVSNLFNFIFVNIFMHSIVVCSQNSEVFIDWKK